MRRSDSYRAGVDDQLVRSATAIAKARHSMGSASRGGLGRLPEAEQRLREAALSIRLEVGDEPGESPHPTVAGQRAA